MVVHVLAVGRLRDLGLKAAGDEYRRRMGRTLKVEVREVPEAGRRAARPEDAPRIEADRLMAAVPSGARLVALSRTGRSVTSADLAEIVRRWREDARDVALLIGGASGLDASVLGTAERTLSLSALTLPHELARLVLLEQLYRAVTILRGEPYHKGAAG
jgi:23S rRNA (pseudouridine1915-N3)-methyltransferase